MARIHDTIVVEGGMPSLGALMGTRASSDVFNSMNATGHSSFFGAEFDQMNETFHQRYVKPMDRIGFDISRAVNALINPDHFRILETVEDFRSIPSCMEIPILMFEPVRKAFMEGRVEGFGYDSEWLPDEDVHGRMIDNFRCNDVAAASDEHGYFTLSGTIYNDDPDLSDDDLWAIRQTREHILNKILKDTDRDPTAIDLMRG